MSNFYSTSKFSELIAQHGPPTKVFKYGTAGFRDDNTLLAPVLLRVGILAAARSENVGGKAIGVMVCL